MRTTDSGHLEARDESESHKSYIRNAHQLRDREFSMLIERVFDHQPAVYGPPPETQPIDPKEELSRANVLLLAHHFYHEGCFVALQLKTGGKLGHAVDSQDLERQLTARTTDNRNELFFLLGDIGSGKTSYINHLLTTRGAAWVESGTAWFVRIDTHRLKKGQMISRQDLIDGLITKTTKIFSRHNTNLLPETLKPLLVKVGQSQGTGRELAFAEFVQAHKRETEMQPVIIIDNLDFLYHLKERILFYTRRSEDDAESINDQNGSLAKLVSDLVTMFVHDSAQHIMDLGASVLFVVRRDSYDILCQGNGLDHIFDANKKTFTISPATWKDVALGRGDLLKFAISQIPEGGKERVHSDILDPILEDLEFAPAGHKPLVDHITKVANHGYRDVVAFFSLYSWLEGQDFRPGARHGIGRLLHQYPVGLLAFMLGGRRRFHQFSSHFPNIYLIDLQESITVMPEGWHTDASHAHTYWLKRLLLRFINHRKEKGQACRVKDIIAAFCYGSGCYDEGLVRAVLSSMAEVHSSNLIRVTLLRSNVSDTIEIKSVMPTDRGIRCDASIFDRFFYLQLIVDDWMMPLPQSVFDDFAYPEFRDAAFDEELLDYNYIARTPSEYSSAVRRMVRLKASQVILFLEILDIALEIEKDLYGAVFNRLGNITLPDVHSIREGVHEELESLGSVIRGVIQLSDLSDHAAALRPRIESDLLSVYLGS